MLRLQGNDCLHFRLAPGQPVPEWLGAMQQQAPRRAATTAAAASDGTAGSFALYSFTKHMAHAPKRVVNDRVSAAAAAATCTGMRRAAHDAAD